MNLSDDELAVVIGDNITQELFEKAKNNQGIDEDENPQSRYLMPKEKIMISLRGLTHCLRKPPKRAL